MRPLVSHCLIGVLACLLISINWYYSFVPFAIYFVFYLKRRARRINYKTVERKAPFLHEKLRTVADNLYKNNEIINSLNQEVLNRIRDVKISAFFDYNAIARRMMVLVSLCVIIIFVVSLNVRFLDFKGVVEKIESIPKKIVNEPYGDVFAPNGFLGEGNKDIYGEKSIAELGTTELNLKISLLSNEIDVTNIGDVKEKEFKSEFPTEIYAKAEASFEEDIPKEHQKIVKNYFNKISKTGG